MSKFQVITFPELSVDELHHISIGLGKKFGFEGSQRLLEDLIKFHQTWASSEEIKDNVLCFTLREIIASIKAFSKGANIYDTIMTIYGARFQRPLKEKMIKFLRHYDTFNDLPKRFILPDNFPKFFKNNSIFEAIKAIKFSIDNNRHVIITGNEGNGKTQLALWFAEWYVKEHKIKKPNLFYCLCTNELKYSDLIGSQSLANIIDPGKDLLEWKNGFLSIAIENGGVVVLDSLDQAPSAITERLNGLFDQIYDKDENAICQIPEIPQNPGIIIHKNFRFFGIVDINNINKMSPAFLNRFNVIFLEDQMESISKVEQEELIRFLLINSYNKNKIKSRILQEEKIEEQLDYVFNFKEDEDDKEDEEDKGDEDDKEDEENVISDESSSIDETYKPTPKLIDLIINKSKEFKTIYKLNQFCRTIRIFISYFKEKVSEDSIVNFCYNILTFDCEKYSFIEIEPKIEDILLNFQNEPSSDETQYFYRHSKYLRNYIAILHACKIANIHLCIYGPPGIGKTLGLRTFG